MRVRDETERQPGAGGGAVSAADHEPGAEQRITVTGTAQQRAWRDRVLPPVERVRPGLWSIPTPFTGSPLRYVLSYLVETPKGPALVDTGWPSDEAWDSLVAGVRETGLIAALGLVVCLVASMQLVPMGYAVLRKGGVGVGSGAV